MLADVRAEFGWLRLVMDSIPEGFALLAPDFAILELNSEAMRIDGRAREDVIGQSHWVAYPETEHHEVGRLYKKAMAERVSISLEHRYVWADGRHGVVCYFYDLSERHASEARLTQAIADKDLLAREIDHRVKNSLTVVGSLLSMQRNASKSDETRAALDEAAARVIAVARVHERLHNSDHLGRIAFGEYLAELCGDLGRSMRRSEIEMDCGTVAIDLPAEQAMSLALIANELITNAFKHGGAAGATKVSVLLTQEAGLLKLTVADNGAGIPALSRAGSASLGLKIVKALTRQLNAESTLPAPGTAAKFVISVPVSRAGGNQDLRAEYAVQVAD